MPVNVDLGAGSNVKCQGCRAGQGVAQARDAGWVVFEPGLSSHPREAPDAVWGVMVMGC